MFLSLLSEETKRELHHAGSSVIYRRNQNLMREGTVLDAVRVLDSGWVKVWARRDGQEQILDLLGPGTILGELELADDRLQLCYITALTDVRATAVQPERFKALADRNPEVYRALAHAITMKFRDEHALRMAHQGAQRLRVLLIRLADRYGRPTPDGLVHVAIPITRTLLASWARLTTAASGKIVTRSFGAGVQFRPDGLLIRRACLDVPDDDL
ncbi:Crp/Fnr family transcriptional regulator [Actinocorallia sp. A-T 12471]|uniref:Crp/Fnr family transcriptional regulator n=1 Tax=Actinocorallia sp. A-T 12471 TaxID=3089813 RepID=UPI0029CBD301|nr:Crp/Fnr family transcriptional regulator [Actinocorallia sp. A-T 12471]MDX6739239.1 Crp/Fnr family transcriptional regulator [Actinocorallia sp. A-T 12471]